MTTEEQAIIDAARRYRVAVLQRNAATILENIGGTPSFGSAEHWAMDAEEARHQLFRAIEALRDHERPTEGTPEQTYSARMRDIAYRNQ